MPGLHPSHRTRFSDASTFDEICELCGAHDEVPGGWGQLEEPCIASDEQRKEYDEKQEEKKRLSNPLIHIKPII